MKTISCFLFLALASVLLMTNGLFAQENVKPQIDPRVYARFDQASVNENIANDPHIMDYPNFFVKEGWYIFDYSKEGKVEAYNNADYPELQKINNQTKEIIPYTITEKDLENFNIYYYDFKVMKERTFYRLGKTNKLLIIYSQQELTEKFNKSRGF
jgi:hypothetical protein